MVIRVPVQLKVYALLLDICQGDVERKVNVLPCMFVQVTLGSHLDRH